MEFVTVHLSDGTTTEVPRMNLDNFRRIHFSRIKFVDEGLDEVPDLGEAIGVEDTTVATAIETPAATLGTFTKTALRDKKIDQLRAIADGLGLDHTGLKKTDLIDAILNTDK